MNPFTYFATSIDKKAYEKLIRGYEKEQTDSKVLKECVVTYDVIFVQYARLCITGGVGEEGEEGNF